MRSASQPLPTPVAVDGDFARAWISTISLRSQSHIPSNNSSSANWGDAPKVQGTIAATWFLSRMTNSIKPNANWLGNTTQSGSPSSPHNFTQVPFFISRDSKTHPLDL